MTKRTQTYKRPMRGSGMTAKEVRAIVAGMAETKRFALANTANVPAAAGTVINLTNGVIQGDNVNERSGDKIKLTKQILRVRFSAVVASQTVRFILFKDNTNRGTTPAVTELLNSASLMSQYNPTTMVQQRFTVLADVSLNGNLNGEAIKERVISRNSKYSVYYSGGTAIATANGPGATFVLVIGETASGLFDIGYEVHYLDL
ncbi:MAG: 21.8 kDa coat protein [Tomato albetovirus 1]|nr:MAG: 21.8 kDa coat protein [Tomato albetovirus 1]